MKFLLLVICFCYQSDVFASDIQNKLLDCIQVKNASVLAKLSINNDLCASEQNYDSTKHKYGIKNTSPHNNFIKSKFINIDSTKSVHEWLKRFQYFLNKEISYEKLITDTADLDFLTKESSKEAINSLKNRKSYGKAIDDQMIEIMIFNKNGDIDNLNYEENEGENNYHKDIKSRNDNEDSNDKEEWFTQSAVKDDDNDNAYHYQYYDSQNHDLNKFMPWSALLKTTDRYDNKRRQTDRIIEDRPVYSPPFHNKLNFKTNSYHEYFMKNFMGFSGEDHDYIGKPKVMNYHYGTTHTMPNNYGWFRFETHLDHQQFNLPLSPLHSHHYNPYLNNANHFPPAVVKQYRYGF